MLEEVAELAHQIGTVIVTGQPPDQDFDQRLAALHGTATQIRPSLRHAGIGDTAITEHKAPELKDHLSALIVDITGNVIPRLIQGRDGYRTLAAYISETVIAKDLSGVLKEPWRLVGIDSHPTVLDALRSVLDDLHALVDELANDDAGRRQNQNKRPVRAEPDGAAPGCRDLPKSQQASAREAAQGDPVQMSGDETGCASVRFLPRACSERVSRKRRP